MRFHFDSAEVFIPDGVSPEDALARTTHLCIAAHQDDIEIMAAAPILECYQQEDKWFTGVVVTDGRGSPRTGLYQQYTDEAMRQVRFKEQRKAALIGEYAALILLDYPSAVARDGSVPFLRDDLAAILMAAQPDIVYIHNLADKHPTHVGTAVRAVQALRSLPRDAHPDRLYGCEVWRGLDWMNDDEKVVLDCSQHDNLQAALLGVFDSQISGGKRYDLATIGRRVANATYFASHGVDESTGMNYAMDLTPLIENPDLDIQKTVRAFIDRFSSDVDALIDRVV